jgi:hypothetical protein
VDPENESAELTLAYMSIDTMKNRIVQLEEENKKLQQELADSKKPTKCPWHHSIDSFEYEEGYNNGLNGHGY